MRAARAVPAAQVMREVIPELEDADAHFLGSLYTVAALDGQTREHLAVSGTADGGGGVCVWRERRVRNARCVNGWESWSVALAAPGVYGGDSGLRCPLGQGLHYVNPDAHCPGFLPRRRFWRGQQPPRNGVCCAWAMTAAGRKPRPPSRYGCAPCGIITEWWGRCLSAVLCGGLVMAPSPFRASAAAPLR